MSQAGEDNAVPDPRVAGLDAPESVVADLTRAEAASQDRGQEDD